MSHDSCALCQMPVSESKLLSGEVSFCCHGCQAVYNILASKQQLANFSEHPIFQKAVRSGLISNPSLLEELAKRRRPFVQEEMQKVYLEITDMWCPSCAEVIRLVLLQELGVASAIVDYATDLASVEFSPRHVSREHIFAIIESLGYCPNTLEDARRQAVSPTLYLRFGIASFCALNIMMFSYPIYASYFSAEEVGYSHFLAWMSFFATIPVVTYCGWPLLRRFYHSLLLGLFGMETLVVLGVSAGLALSTYELWRGSNLVYFDSLTVIIAFMLLGKIIETRAKFTAKDALVQLHRSLPKRGRKRLADGSLQFVPIKEIQVGDVLVATTGDKIVLDGTVVEGSGACDESLMTGESLPVTKVPGNKIIAGALLKQGWLAYTVTATIERTALQKIIEMVEEDVGHKSTYVRAADAWMHWFVPSIVLLAGGTALVCWLLGVMDGDRSPAQTALIRMMSMLLISCPCAIGIAAPLAESYLLNSLAKIGVIVRNRGCLPLLPRITLFVFDKTGTLTEGRFEMREGTATLAQEHLSALKTLALHSNHPLCRAIAEAVDAPVLPSQSVQEHAGKGMQGTINGQDYKLGSAAFVNAAESAVEGITTTVFFASEGKMLAQIALGDKMRPGTSEAVSSLPAPAVILSGDSASAVSAVAKACNISTWHASCSPFQKRAFIETERQKGHVVCMLGDGINDAPSLTAAHVGISVVSASDMSIQVSDILLTTDRLEVIPNILALAKKGQTIIRQNLFWAFSYNIIGVGLAATGLLSPLFAAFAMVISSLMVTYNASRLTNPK